MTRFTEKVGCFMAMNMMIKKKKKGERKKAIATQKFVLRQVLLNLIFVNDRKMYNEVWDCIVKD